MRASHQLVGDAPTPRMQSGDTIAAISSSVGQAARMIVRLSGPHARAIAQTIASNRPSSTSGVERIRLILRNLSVPAWVYWFDGPRSYTGEDVVEFHIPGNALLARMLLDETIARGARHAEPGEFTARAYFNGRIDLAAAEGVAATIAAQNARELHAARQLLAGELARRLRPTLDSLADALALVEVGIDFSEEDVTFLSQCELAARIRSADRALEQLLAECARFETLSHEPRIVLVGRPNAGKSTLLNALSGHERAVVSPQAGTTRDAIWSRASLERGAVRIIDVAGLDETAPSSDEISQKMQQTARRAIEQADVVVAVTDITDARSIPHMGVSVDLIVLTKMDLAALAPSPCPQEEGGGEGRSSPKTEEPSPQPSPCGQGEGVPASAGKSRTPVIAISARTGQNMNALRKHLDILAFGQAAAGATLALNSRHVEAIVAAREGLHRAGESLKAQQGPEIIALELRSVLDDLGRVLGSVTPDDVLGRIFAGFCIGK